MSVPLVYLDIDPAQERRIYVDSLIRVGIGVTERSATLNTVVAEGRHLVVRTALSDDVRLSRDVHPDDLAQVMKCLLALSQARVELRLSQEVERRALKASTIVHDANNALVPILFAAQELCALGPETRALAQPALDSAEHMATMFRTLLSPRTAAVAAPLDVNAAIADFARLLQPTEHVPVTTRLAAAIPPVAIDPNELARVLLNLVANAREAVANANPVTIATSMVQLSEPDARGLPAGRWVLIEVSDSGAGMDPLTLARATEPFFTTKRATSGTGLGLSSALHLVREAGGRLYIDSAEGVGTCVRMFLPA